jgi:hypothetical protein
VAGRDAFHEALGAAIRSYERFAASEARVRRSKRLSGDARELVATSKELVRQAAARLDRTRGSAGPPP